LRYEKVADNRTIIYFCSQFQEHVDETIIDSVFCLADKAFEAAAVYFNTEFDNRRI
jgi:hypothetical protein